MKLALRLLLVTSFIFGGCEDSLDIEVDVTIENVSGTPDPQPEDDDCKADCDGTA